jgi:tetratricopeptide (TPR) repeat protein
MTRVNLLIAALCLVAASAVRADPVDVTAAEAQRHWTAGMAHFQLEEWDEAIKDWEAGFRLKPVPQFLYNIAQAYRQSKRYDKALSFYRKYLRMSPDAPNRGEVEGHIATLDRLVAEQQKATSSPPVQPLPSAGVSEKAAPAATTPTPAPPPEAASPQSAPTAEPAAAPQPARVELTAPAPAKESVAHKAWFWGVVGGAAAIVAAAVVVGVLVGTADSTKTLPLVRF